ncbi:uncharacterized protein LOC142410785 [Mycteria americana]|uniref:uncharacterized protein LOC142410785 n=1 Tax=Mycteria americana TaxID=33587 RepID=UPI003F587C91
MPDCTAPFPGPRLPAQPRHAGCQAPPAPPGRAARPRRPCLSPVRSGWRRCGPAPHTCSAGAHKLVPAGRRRARWRPPSLPPRGERGQLFLFLGIASLCGGVGVCARPESGGNVRLWAGVTRAAGRPGRGVGPSPPRRAPRHRPGARRCRRGDGAAGGDGVLPLSQHGAGEGRSRPRQRVPVPGANKFRVPASAGFARQSGAAGVPPARHVDSHGDIRLTLLQGKPGG